MGKKFLQEFRPLAACMLLTFSMLAGGHYLSCKPFQPLVYCCRSLTAAMLFILISS
jgi:hypothetical protein